MRDRAIGTISTDMAISGFKKSEEEIILSDVDKEVRRKLKSLKSTNHLEVGNMENSIKSGMSTENLYVPNMKWFSMMDEYLKNVSDKKDTIANLELPTGTSSRMELDTEGCGTSTAQLPRQRVLNGQRKRKHSALLEASTNLQSIWSSLPNTSTEDEFDAFRRIIAMGLRKLPPDITLADQSELLAVHTKYQLKYVKTLKVQ